jgi:hypothetical protein
VSPFHDERTKLVTPERLAKHGVSQMTVHRTGVAKKTTRATHKRYKKLMNNIEKIEQT